MTTTSVDTSSLISRGILEIGDGYRAKNDELGDSGIPFARAGNINNGFHFSDAALLADANISRAGSKISQPGDVVFTSKGTVGRFAFVQNETSQFVYSPQLCYWRSRNKEYMWPRWLYYWMFGNEFQAQMNRVKGQTDMAEYVSLSDQRRMKITLPPLPEQRAVANVLGALDDKIELNRRMNATLEEMAQTLFRSWFVDFDPVKAKADGLEPEGIDTEIAGLFPGSFENSEIGMIPQGWEIGVLTNVAENPRRGVDPRSLDPLTPYIGLEHMPRKSFALAEQGTTSNVESGKSAFQSDEILFGKLRPYFHKVGIAITDGVCSTDILVIAPARGWQGFVLGHVFSDPFVEHVTACSDGTRMPRTSWGDMNKFRFALPSQELAQAFNNQVSPLFNKIKANIHENRHLVAMRDTLLQKLISGEITLPEEMVQEFIYE